jgi:hypothetical protein
MSDDLTRRLEAAYQDGYADGYRDGREEALDEIDDTWEPDPNARPIVNVIESL